MKRRPFLHLAAGAVATAGCLGRSELSEESSSSTTATVSTTTASTTATGPSTAEGAESDAGPLAVERVEAFDHVVRMNDLGDDPGGAISAFADLDDRERTVVERALDEGHETDDPPEWLVEFAAGTPFVERSGTYYRVDHDLPTTAITAEAVDETDVDGQIAGSDEYREAVTHDGRVMSGLLRIARDEGVEFTHVWPSLREFLDAYGAVRYHGDVVSFSVEVEDSGPPYAVTATEISVSEAARAEVWNVSDADGESRDLVRRAGEYSGAYGFDSAPDGFFEQLDAHRYAYLDGTFYTTYVEKRDPAPVTISAEFVDGELKLALRNDADRELDVNTGAPRPFGVLYAHSVGDSEMEGNEDGKEDRHTLWTDAYEEDDHVHTEGREVRSVNSIGLVVTVAPGETLSETYEVAAEELPSGEYAVDGSVGVETGDGGETGDAGESGDGGETGDAGESGDAGGTVRYRVAFSVR